jgi:hypothetical protein
MKPPVTARARHLFEGIDRFCGRCNDGLTAVAIVLAIIITLLAAVQGAHALRVPEGFEPVGTTT